jgi:extracellular elastinolytic metalloproteinase
VLASPDLHITHHQPQPSPASTSMTSVSPIRSHSAVLVLFASLFAFAYYSSTYSKTFKTSGYHHQNDISTIHALNKIDALASEAVRNAAVSNPEKFGINLQDIQTMHVSDSVPSAKRGVHHVYLTQKLSGIPIHNSRLSALVQTSESKRQHYSRYSRRKLLQEVGSEKDSENNWIEGSDVLVLRPSASSSLVKDAAKCINMNEPLLTPEDAVSFAARSILAVGTKALNLTVKEGNAETFSNPTHMVIFESHDGVSMNAIQCQLAFWSVAECDIRLAWEVTARPNNTHWLQMLVDAKDGTPLHVSNFVRGASSFSAVPYPIENPCPSCPSYSKDLSESVSFDTNDIEPLSLASNPEWEESSPNGWLMIDGILYNETRGNNIRAAYNISEEATLIFDRLSGETAKATNPELSVFDYSYQNIMSDDPSRWREAAIVNVFYWCNIMHDILYQYGFDEPSGNFQEENFGLGGIGGDSVVVEVQVRFFETLPSLYMQCCLPIDPFMTGAGGR